MAGRRLWGQSCGRIWLPSLFAKTRYNCSCFGSLDLEYQPYIAMTRCNCVWLGSLDLEYQPHIAMTRYKLCGGGGTDLERGYRDVRPWRPPFHASPAACKGPISSKRVSSQDPLLRKLWNFSLYSLNFHQLSSQAPKFGNFQLTSPQIWKFSTHKPPPPFQRQMSVRKPHTSEIRAAHPYLKKKLSAPPPREVVIGIPGPGMSTFYCNDPIQVFMIGVPGPGISTLYCNDPIQVFVIVVPGPGISTFYCNDPIYTTSVHDWSSWTWNFNLILQWPDTTVHDWGPWTWNINLLLQWLDTIVHDRLGPRTWNINLKLQWPNTIIVHDWGPWTWNIIIAMTRYNCSWLEFLDMQYQPLQWPDTSVRDWSSWTWNINLLLQWLDTIVHDWGSWTWNFNLLLQWLDTIGHDWVPGPGISTLYCNDSIQLFMIGSLDLTINLKLQRPDTSDSVHDWGPCVIM